MTPKDKSRDGGVAPDPALARARDVAFEISCDLIGSADVENHFIALNGEWERRLGHSKVELMSRPFVEFVHAADRPATEAELARLAGGSASAVGFEHRFATAEGGWRWLSWQVQSREDGNYFIVRDVTEQVGIEQRRQLLMNVVEGVDDAIFTKTIDGVVTSWNRVSEELFGYTAKEAVGRDLGDLIVPKERKEEPGVIVGRLLGGEGVRQYTTQRHRKDGTVLTVSLTASLMRDHQQNILGVVVVTRDISELSLEDVESRGEIDTLVWVGRVRDAIDEDRIVFYAQPIIGVRGQPKSYEFLCRMMSREGEMIQPGQFLPAAENYGLIEEIDLLAVKAAAKQIALGFEISINLPTSTVGRRHVVDAIADALRREGAPASGLTVEITETALMKDVPAARRFADDLSSLGIHLALDDFGTGFGGFTYLKKLPIHRLKIDVEFVKDLPTSRASQQVVKAVVALADGFGLDTVAEGVEDQRSRELLEEYGVDFMQGFHLGRPGPMGKVLSGPTLLTG